MVMLAGKAKAKPSASIAGWGPGSFPGTGRVPQNRADVRADAAAHLRHSFGVEGYAALVGSQRFSSDNGDFRRCRAQWYILWAPGENLIMSRTTAARS